ncbi:MAG: ammonium transporter [Candidatus Altiarchaeales archaeon]|nr:ammonium transporter [Candidatus Altiarchaeales archaeon]MBD3417021.1 ammonium transporter [Candidatus Altiarchaeales archaeon]
MEKSAYTGIILVVLAMLLPAGVAEDGTTAETNAMAIDTIWTLLAAVLVFFMQPGFAMVEAGFTRAKNTCNILMKNIMDFAAGSIAYYIAGFGIMFGAGTAFFGAEYFFLSGVSPDSMWGSVPTYAFWIFQAVFAATAATIVSGAMAERTKFVSYLVYSFTLTILIYPLVGHWIWGGGWLSTGAVFGFLADAPLVDFAGSTVVHSVGGWAALAGAIVLGPRVGKYVNGKVNVIPGHNIALAALGGFILWFGWFGFNAGSTVAGTDLSIATIAVTTNLAAAAGAITAMFTIWALAGKPDVSMTINGFLAGLVGITAGCASVSPLSALIIGAVAGVIVVFAVEFVDKFLRVDDPVGAVSVHGVCGAFGTLAVGVFAEEAYGGVNGLLFGGGVTQLISQAVGVVSVFLFVFPVAFLMFKVIDLTLGLRVSEHEEVTGLDIGEHGMFAYPDFDVPA